MTPKALLFDLDGTLIETDHIHAAVFAELGREHGVTIDRARYDAEIQGRLNADIFADLFPQADPAALAEVKEAEVRRRLSKEARPVPGLRGVLAWAARRAIPTAVVTNAPRANADAMLGALDLGSRFATLIVGEECRRGKPDPDPYQIALERTGAAADGALAFEDSRSGVAAARDAGVAVIGLTSSLPEDALYAAGAESVIRDFADPGLWARLGRGSCR